MASRKDPDPLSFRFCTVAARGAMPQKPMNKIAKPAVVSLQIKAFMSLRDRLKVQCEIAREPARAACARTDLAFIVQWNSFELIGMYT